MKKKLIVCFLLFILYLSIYPKIVATFSDVGKVGQLRINEKYLFIADKNFVFAYELNSFKMIKKLNKNGEGPGEFKFAPVVEFTRDKIILAGSYKIGLLNKSFKTIREIRLTKFRGHVIPIGDNFIISESKYHDDEKYDTIFSMLNEKAEKIKELVIVPHGPYNNYFFMYFPRARNWNEKLFIAQPHKGLFLDVFDNKGNFLYKINKNVKKIKAEEKHKQLSDDEMLFLLGKSVFERYKNFGTYKNPMQNYVPEIKNFWVIDDKIYVKTFDLKGKTEKFIIMDLKGNIIKKVFLPITFGELLTFHNNTFYYLKDNGENESWDLHSIQL